jgi:hypothetical protein
VDQEVSGPKIDGEGWGGGGEGVVDGPLLKLLVGQLGPGHPELLSLFGPRGVHDAVVVDVREGEGASLAADLVGDAGGEIVGLLLGRLATVVAEVSQQTVRGEVNGTVGENDIAAIPSATAASRAPWMIVIQRSKKTPSISFSALL